MPGATAVIEAAVAGEARVTVVPLHRRQRAGSAVRTQGKQDMAISSSPVAETTFRRLPEAARWTNGEVEARLIEPRPMAVLSDSGSVVVGFQGPGLDSMGLDEEPVTRCSLGWFWRLASEATWSLSRYVSRHRVTGLTRSAELPELGSVGTLSPHSVWRRCAPRFRSWLRAHGWIRRQQPIR
jgi:hypothetical protein